MGIYELQSNTVNVVPSSEVDRIRYPDIINSTGYLEDPIQYRRDNRFLPTTVVKQFPELPNQIRRDFADFLQIDSNNDTPQLLTVNMFSNVTRRDLYAKVIRPRANFTQLGVTR